MVSLTTGTIPYKFKNETLQSSDNLKKFNKMLNAIK